MADTEERGTHRSGRPLRIRSGCTRRRIRVPASYQELEDTVMQWMAGCVVTRSLTDERGLPLNRHVSLVRGNTSLGELWTRIAHLRGRMVTVHATYVRRNADHGYHVDEVRFDIPGPRARVIEPDDFDMTPVNPDDFVPRGIPAVPDLPDEPEEEVIVPDFDGPIVDELWKGLRPLLEGYRHALAVQREVPLYRGKADGYCDSLAIAATHPDLDVLARQRDGRASTLIDVEADVPDGAVIRGGVAIYIQGYREGRRTARRVLQSLENRGRTQPQTPRSVDFLQFLRTRYGPTKESIRSSLIRRFVPDPLQEQSQE